MPYSFAYRPIWWIYFQMSFPLPDNASLFQVSRNTKQYRWHIGKIPWLCTVIHTCILFSENRQYYELKGLSSSFFLTKVNLWIRFMVIISERPYSHVLVWSISISICVLMRKNVFFIYINFTLDNSIKFTAVVYTKYVYEIYFLCI